MRRNINWKKLLWPVWVCVGAWPVCAQTNMPVGGNVPAPVVTPAPLPTPYSHTAKLNYVRIWKANAPEQQATVMPQKNVEEVETVTGYTDGFGRVLQKVKKQATPAKNDLVSPVLYNTLGREEYHYLPFAATVMQPGDIANDGNFKFNAFQQSAAFNGSEYAGEQFFYKREELEPSPLKRTAKTFSPGNSWAGSNRGVSVQWGINTVADSVYEFEVNTTTGIPFTTGFYLTGSLVKTTTVDEDGKVLVEYKNRNNKPVLVKTKWYTAGAAAHTGWLCTYYVYDVYGNQRVVLPPKAVEFALAQTGTVKTLTAGVTNELCFRYQYDEQGLVLRKTIPGSGDIYMVYDARKRLVMIQDSVQRFQGKWIVNRYDELNRLVQTGVWINNTGFAAHLAAAKTSTNYPAPASNYTVLTEIYFDNYDWATGIAGISKTLNTTGINSTNFITQYNVAPYYAKPVAMSNHTRGMVTGTKMNWLGTVNYSYTINFYNDKGEVVQVQTTNNKGGTDIVSTQYDFSGKVLRSLLQHYKGNTNPQAHTLLTKNEYDHGGRLIQVTKSINGSPDKAIARSRYNETGLLKEKIAGNNLERSEHKYHIRGWLNSINEAYVNGNEQPGAFFGQVLHYDHGFAVNNYNGNISGQRWKSAGDGVQRAFGYSYDAVNRLTAADFNQQNTNAAAWTKDRLDFSVQHLKYDANGNILSMQQKGVRVASIVNMDALRYDYFPNSNKLRSVTDSANDPLSRLGDFKDGPNGSADDYTYDANGNLTRDLNKNMVNGVYPGIGYNVLNLPEVITVKGKGIITYLYDAAGRKTRKRVVDSTASPVKITVTDYISGFVYENDTLQYVSTENGQIRRKDSTNALVFDYYVTDHLGNIRMVLTEQKDTAMYTATLETAAAAKENALFANIENTRYAKSLVGGYPADNTTSPNDYISKINGTDGQQKVGPALLLKVMAGDTVSVQTKYFFKSAGQNNTSNQNNLLTQVLAAFGGTGSTTPLGGKTTTGVVNSQVFQPGFISTVLNPLQNNGQNQADKPRAYLNMILFDEQFNLVPGNSLVRQVQTADALTNITVPFQRMQKNGYLYIYLSNESPMNVYFDNLAVNHQTGPIMEETHYYPFGGTMAAISSRAALKKETKQKYNGKELQNKEFSDGAGIEWYDYGARMYDAQISRFMKHDRLAEKYHQVSPYQYALNNPVKFVDENGDEVKIVSQTQVDFSGQTTTTTNYFIITGKLINATGREIPMAQMQGFVNRINGAIRNSIKSDLSVIKTRKTVNVVIPMITVGTKDNPAKDSDHKIFIVKDGELPFSRGDFGVPGTNGIMTGGKLIYLSESLFSEDRYPAAKGPYAGTGLTEWGKPSLERTVAHETGHTLGLEDNPDEARSPNLMNQTATGNTGEHLTEGQVKFIKQQYDKGKLNKPVPNRFKDEYRPR